MKKIWKWVLKKKKIQVSLVVVLILWGLAVADKLGNIFVWETFLPEITKSVEEDEKVKELFERCQGEGVIEYYEGMGSCLNGNQCSVKDLKLWLEKSLKKTFPSEIWEIEMHPEGETKCGKIELRIENKNKTISGRIRMYFAEDATEKKNYIHCGFQSKGREDSIYLLKNSWNEKMEKDGVKNYQDYFYRSLYFQGKLTNAQQKQAIKQYLYHFGAKEQKSDLIEKMEHGYGYTEKIKDFRIVDGRKINIHIAFSYDEQEDKTWLYLATPFLNTDY